ncbi:hypothetical protein [Zhouia spongiae]|nr:hypothetical protein [Zhouia spongiae]
MDKFFVGLGVAEKIDKNWGISNYNSLIIKTDEMLVSFGEIFD